MRCRSANVGSRQFHGVTSARTETWGKKMTMLSSAISTQTPAQATLDVLNWLFPTLILVFGSVALVAVILYWVGFARRTQSLRTLVGSIDRRDLVATRTELCEEATRLDPKVLGPQWHEFDETLVVTYDGERLYNTVEAEYFFNRSTIASEYSTNRLLAAAPTILASVGVFGTFLALYLGLSGLNIDNPDELEGGVQQLMSAAGVAFLKSVWGVGASLALMLVEKVFEWYMATKLAPIQNQIDRIYKRTTPEKSLLDVADFTRGSMLALQDLHERIGNRLQETVQTLATNMESAVRGAIDTALTPAMERLVESTTQQSTEVFDQLVGRFASSFTEIGVKQAAALDESSTRLSSSISEVSRQFTDLVEQSRSHSAEIASQQADVLSALTTTATTLGETTADLSAAAASLNDAGARIEESGSTIGKALQQTSATLFALYEKAIQQADEIERMRDQSRAIEGVLESAANRLADASIAFSGELVSLRDAQATFQAEVRADADDFAAALRAHVLGLEEQVAKWLADYSADIERQTADRMSTWDELSRDYATNMLSTARGLREVLDEIQMRADVESALVPLEEAAVAEDLGNEAAR